MSMDKLKELTVQLVKARADKARAKELEDAAKAIIADISEQISTIMLNMGVTSVKIQGLGTPILVTESTPFVVDKKKFFAYLDNTEQGSMAERTINANTLKSWYNNGDIEAIAEEIGLGSVTKTKINFRKG